MSKISSNNSAVGIQCIYSRRYFRGGACCLLHANLVLPRGAAMVGTTHGFQCRLKRTRTSVRSHNGCGYHIETTRRRCLLHETCMERSTRRAAQRPTKRATAPTHPASTELLTDGTVADGHHFSPPNTCEAAATRREARHVLASPGSKKMCWRGAGRGQRPACRVLGHRTTKARPRPQPRPRPRPDRRRQ